MASSSSSASDGFPIASLAAVLDRTCGDRCFPAMIYEGNATQNKPGIESENRDAARLHAIDGRQATFAAACRRLSGWRVQAAPIVTVSDSGPKQRFEVKGIFSVLNATQAVLQLFPKSDLLKPEMQERWASLGLQKHRAKASKDTVDKGGESPNKSSSNSLPTASLSDGKVPSKVSTEHRKGSKAAEELDNLAVQFVQTPIVDLIDSMQTDFSTVHATQPLKDAIQLMVDTNAHRVVVLGSSTSGAAGSLHGLVTQSRVLDLCNAVAADIPRFHQRLSSLKDLKGREQVLSFARSAPVYDAFEAMVQKGVSGVPIIDPETKYLVGTLSASDIKLLGSDFRHWYRLRLTCEEYIDEITRQRKAHNIRNQVISDVFEEPQEFVVSVRESQTLATAIRRLCYYQLHRIYITASDDATLVGILTPLDVLREVLKQLDEEALEA